MEKITFLYGQQVMNAKGGNANYYAYANSRYAITVAASGVAGHYDSDSNPGANVLINAPVPSCTTDLPGDEGYNPIYDNSPPIVGVYALTSYSFEQLQQKQMPDDIIQQLQSIKNKEFYLKETFLAVIQQQIGEEQCKKYQERLLYHAYHSEKFRVDGQGEFENKNYTRSFAGTSAATPFVTRVIALMRQANPPKACACEESGGGVVCSFGTPKPNGSTAHYGRMALLPQEADPPSVSLLPFVSSETTQHGLHLLPNGLRLEVQPNAEWFGDCEQQSAEARCPDSLDCQGEDAKNPQCLLPDPQEQPEIISLPYQIAAQEDRERDTFQVTVTYTLPDGSAKEAALTIQPARLCRSVTDRSGETGVQEAQAICGWEPVNTTQVYASNERDDEDTHTVSIVPPTVFSHNGIGWSGKYDCYQRDYWGGRKGFERCVESPAWRQCPSPIRVYRTVPTASGSGTRQVLISTTTYSCAGWVERQVVDRVGIYADADLRWAQLMSGQSVPYLEGWHYGSITTTWTNWSGEWVSQCRYRRATQRIEPPASGMGLDVIIPLRDSEAEAEE